MFIASLIFVASTDSENEWIIYLLCVIGGSFLILVGILALRTGLRYSMNFTVLTKLNLIFKTSFIMTINSQSINKVKFLYCVGSFCK